jgi:hypothetical protein
MKDGTQIENVEFESDNNSSVKYGNPNIYHNSTYQIQYSENIIIPSDIGEDYNCIQHEENLINKKIALYLEYSRKLKDSSFEIENNQKFTFNEVLNQLVNFLPSENFKVLFTQDNEIQLFYSLRNGTISLIIDEFGGLTFSQIMEKGYGYKYNYLEFEKIDKKNVYVFSKNFISNLFS